MCPFCLTCLAYFCCFIVSKMVSSGFCHLILDRAGVIIPIYRRGNWVSDGSMKCWGHMVSTCYSQASENNGYFNCSAIGRRAYAQFLDKDPCGEKWKNLLLKYLATLGSCPNWNKGTEVDTWKAYESFSWQNSLWQFECFMTFSSQETII